MNKVFQYLACALLGVAGASTAFGGEKEEAAFRRIYGAQEQTVTTSRDKKKHLEFGKKLVADSRKQGVSQAWEESLEDHAIEHLRQSGQKEAYEVILQIHKDDMQDFPDDTSKYLRLMIQDARTLLKKISFKDKTNKKEVQQFIADTHNSLADVLEQKGAYAEAATQFGSASSKYRSLRDYDKSRESSLRATENKKFQTAEDRQKDLEKRAQRGDKKAHLAVGVERFKQGEYDKAKQHFLHADGAEDYLKIIALLTTNPNERVTPNGIGESAFRDLKTKNERKNTEGLVDLILQFTKESTLRRTAVVAAGKINYNEADRWDYLTGFSSTAENFMDREGKTPDFDLQKTIQAARLFEDVAKKEERRYVKAGLLGKSFGLYTVVKREAKEGTLESTEANTKVATLEKELARYGGVKVGGLELVAAGPKIPKGAVLYMTFDRGSIVQGDIKDGKIVKGDTWIVKDLSGKGNHGVIYGNAQTGQGIDGNALILRGREYIVVKNSQRYDSFTISIWVNFTNIDDHQNIITRKDGNGIGRDILSIYNKSIMSFISNRVIDTTFKPMVDNWNHYALTYNNQQLDIYINGEKKISSNALEEGASGDFIIASHKDAKKLFLHGSVDELIAFNRNLSKEEILNLYRLTKN